jgi:hypothetical protein
VFDYYFSDTLFLGHVVPFFVCPNLIIVIRRNSWLFLFAEYLIHNLRWKRLPVDGGLPDRFPSRWFHLRQGCGGQAGEAALHLYLMKNDKKLRQTVFSGSSWFYTKTQNILSQTTESFLAEAAEQV